MANQFVETRNMFSDYTGIKYHQQLTYDEWMQLPDSHRAAALFVVFFDEITLAWSKAKADFVPDEDGLECVLHYLEKNAKKKNNFIYGNPERYTANYIYRVAYNCMDCLRYVEREKFRSRLESSNVVEADGDTLDLFDKVPDDIDFDLEEMRSEFWKTLEDFEDVGLKDKVAKVVNHLLNGDSLHKVSSRSKNRDNDPLKDVGVSKKEYTAIVEMLKEKLFVYKEAFLGADEDLVVASEEDLVPLNLRKQATLTDQIYSFLQKRGSINLFEAERYFLLTRIPLNHLIHSMQDKGLPILAHWVDVQDQSIPGKEIEMIDYYYLADTEVA